MQRAAKESIPRGHRAIVKPFWNDEIDAADKANNKARAKCHQSEGDAMYYKATRDELYKITKKAQEESWQNYASGLDPTTNPSKVWRAIAAMDGRKRKNKPGTNIHYGNKTATTDLEKAKLFIKSYQQESKINKYKATDKPRVHAHRKAVSKCSNCNGEQVGMCCPFSMTELRTALLRLKKGKSPGTDNVSNEMQLNTSRLPPATEPKRPSSNFTTLAGKKKRALKSGRVPK